MRSLQNSNQHLAAIGICSGDQRFVCELLDNEVSNLLNIVFSPDANKLKQVVVMLHRTGCRKIFVDGSDLNYLGLLRWGTHFFNLNETSVAFFNPNQATRHYVESFSLRNELFAETVKVIQNTVQPHELMASHILVGASINAHIN